MSSSSGSESRCKGYNLGMLDMFGTTPRFKMNGSTNYKTVFGCFWSLVTSAILVVAVIYYSDVYTDKSQPNLTSEYIQTSTKPFMNLTEKGIFIVMAFKKDGAFVSPGSVDGYFKIESNLLKVTSPKDGVTKVQPTVTKIPFNPCKSAGYKPLVNGEPIQGPTSRLLSDFGYCSNSSSTSLYVDGDEDSDEYTLLEIRIIPCMGTLYKGTGPIPRGSCGLPAPTKTQTLKLLDIAKLRSELRRFEIIFAFVDSSIQPENYSNPIFYKLNTANSYFPMVVHEKVIEVRYNRLIVNTDEGVFIKNYRTDLTYSLQAPSYDSKDRGPNDMEEFLSASGKQLYPLPYITLQVRSGNEQITYTRQYTKLLDIIGLLGGILQTATTVIVILYGWYNGIMMEKDTLNKALVQHYQDTKFSKIQRSFGDLDAQEIPVSQPVSEQIQLEKEDVSKFTFGQIFKFTYFTRCMEKHPKWKLYNRCNSIAQDNTDITKIIRGVSDLEVLRGAIFTKEQQLLLPYVETYPLFRNGVKSESFRRLDSGIHPNQLTEEQMRTAVRELLTASLKSKMSGPTEDKKVDLVDQRISQYLIARSPVEPVENSACKEVEVQIFDTEQIDLQIPEESEPVTGGVTGTHPLPGDNDPLPA